MRLLFLIALGLGVVTCVKSAVFEDSSSSASGSQVSQAWVAPILYESCITDDVNFVDCAASLDGRMIFESLDVDDGSAQWQVMDGNAMQPSNLGTVLLCPQQPELVFLVEASAGAWTGTFSAMNKTKSLRQTLWTFNIQASATDQMALHCSLDGALVYLLTPSTFFALDALTGTLQWTQFVNRTSPYRLVEVPHVNNATTSSSSVFFVDTLGLHRIDSATGKPLDFSPPSEVLASALPLGVTGSVALFNTSMDTVVALTASGEFLWSTAHRFVAVQGGVLITNASVSTFVGLDASSGDQLWSIDFAHPDVPHLAAINADHFVVTFPPTVGLYPTYNRVEGHSMVTGQVLWVLFNVRTQWGQTFSSPGYLGFVAPGACAITAIKLSDGTTGTLPIGRPSSTLVETSALLIVQNDTNAVAYWKW